MLPVLASAWTVTLVGRVDDNGLIRLNWSSTYTGTDAHIYEVWRCAKTSCTDGDWERLSTFAIEEDSVNVLNVYPSEGVAKDIMADFTFYDKTTRRLNKAAALKVWMESGTQKFNDVITTFDAAGRHPQTGEHLISVTLMSATAFESRVSEMWNYDVLVYGTWDASGRVSTCYQSSNYRNENYPRPSTVREIGRYIDNGFGVIAGHDSISGNFNADIGLCQIRDKFGIEVTSHNTAKGPTNGNWCPNLDTKNVGFCQYRSTQVDVIKLGLITDFPWNIYGQRLNIPESHTWNNIATGIIWIELANGTYDSRSTETCRNLGTAGKWFLNTYKNTAVLQTGHSNCESTEAERKVIANTIYYLKQRTQRNWSYDMSAKDYSPPKAPTCHVSYYGGLEFTCTTTDEIKTYKYKVFERKKNDYLVSVTSNIVEVAQGGVKSFTYWVEGMESTRTTLYTEDIFSPQVKFSLDLPPMEVAYLNIYATDVTGNDSPITVFEFKNVFTDDWHDYHHDRQYGNMFLAAMPLYLVQF